LKASTSPGWGWRSLIKSRFSDMEKKHRISDKVEAKPPQFQPRPLPKTQPALNEKDRAILDDVENIIWNPDRLKKLKDDGKPMQGK
jgi:hypothetical protein